MGWSSLLIGRIRDPIVGRDVLIGVTIGMLLTVADRLLELWMRTQAGWSPNLAPYPILAGGRHVIGLLLMNISHAVRESLFFFFLVFLFRVVLRKEWLAAVAFATLFAGFNLVADHPIPGVVLSFFALFAFAVALMRWGLLTLGIAILSSNIVEHAPVTANASAWYFTSALMLVAGVALLAAWAFRTSLGARKVWNPDLLG